MPRGACKQGLCWARAGTSRLPERQRMRLEGHEYQTAQRFDHILTNVLVEVSHEGAHHFHTLLQVRQEGHTHACHIVCVHVSVA